MEKLLSSIFGIPVAFAQAAADNAKETSGAINILAFVIEHLPLWITAIVVFIASLIIGGIVKSIVESRLASKISDEHQEVLIISGRVAFVSVVAIGITLALAIAGINITAIIAALGFGISFGLQDTVANFVAGLALLASRPFIIGDWIEIDGQKGKVMEIRTRATYLQTYDGLRLIVPNSQLYKSKVLSYTSNPMRRLKVPVYARYGADVKEVMAICMNVVKSNPKIFLQPKPNIVVTDLADSYMSFEVRFWVDSKGLWKRIQSHIFIEIQKRLEAAGLDSPYAVTSLSMEPDIESVIFKTRQVEKEELSAFVSQRQAEDQKYTQTKEKLTQPRPAASSPIVTVDQSGSAFLSAPVILPPAENPSSAA